jgi:hypothetical protein
LRELESHVGEQPEVAALGRLVAAERERAAGLMDEPATSFTPPEPASTSMRVIDSHLDQGEYVFPLPAEVSPVASFVTVSVGPAVRAFTVGAMPEAVMRTVPAGDPAQPSALPPVRAVATHSDV